MRTIATLTVTASLLAALSGCGNDEPDPAVVKSVSALTGASTMVTSAAHAYKRANSHYPSKITQKGGELIVDGVTVTSSASYVARLGWYRTQGSGYAYCIQTATAHQITSGAGGDKPRVKLDSGPCTTK